MHSALIELVKQRLKDGRDSITGLADRTGCSRPHLSAVLNGHAQLSVDMAEKLASAIDAVIEVKQKESVKST